MLRRVDFEHNETLLQRIAADPNAADPRPSNAADPKPPTQSRRPNAADPAHGPRRGGAMGIQGYRPCMVGIPCRERATPT